MSNPVRAATPVGPGRRHPRRRRPARTALAAAALTPLVAVASCGQGQVVEGATQEGPTYVWTMTTTSGATSTWYEGGERFAELLDERSGGRMQLQIYTNEQLSGGDPAAGVEQLMNGDKDFSYNSTIIYAGIDPRFGAINAPFLFSDLEEAEAVMTTTAVDAYRDLSAEHGVQLLGFGESGFRQITNDTRAIETPEDLSGIKLRIPGFGLFTDAFRSMDANPSTMNFAEVFTALQQGTIDGQENPIDIIHSSSLNEVQEHLTMANYSYDPLILGMNKEAFDSLSDADQQIVMESAADANVLQIDSNREREEGQVEELRGQMQVVDLSPEQVEVFRDHLNPLYAQYVQVWGPQMTEAIITPSEIEVSGS